MGSDELESSEVVRVTTGCASAPVLRGRHRSADARLCGDTGLHLEGGPAPALKQVLQDENWIVIGVKCSSVANKKE
jgi:hypothetical protein